MPLTRIKCAVCGRSNYINPEKNPGQRKFCNGCHSVIYGDSLIPDVEVNINSKSQSVRAEVQKILNKSVKDDIMPSLSIWNKLLDFKVAIVKDGLYAVSPEFLASIEDMREASPGRVWQMKQLKKVQNDILPVFLAFGIDIMRLRGRAGYENIVEAAVCFEWHRKRLNLQIDENDLPNILYATYYLNNHDFAKIENIVDTLELPTGD